MKEFMVFAAFVILAALLFYVAKMLIRRKGQYIDDLTRFTEKSKCFDGIVLGVNKAPVGKNKRKIRAVILQFRDTERKCTIVHRYIGSKGINYKRGDKVEVYYNEETDSACITDDNPFCLKAKQSLLLSKICKVVSIIAFISGVVYIIANKIVNYL